MKESYAAGIIDGEGSIGVSRKSKINGSYYNYLLVVQVTMRSPAIPGWLATNFGGHVGRYEQSKRAFGKGYMSKWAIFGDEAKGFIEQILPYLIEKKNQAELALQFPMGKRGYRASLSAEAKEEQYEIYMLMQELNSKKITIIEVL